MLATPSGADLPTLCAAGGAQYLPVNDPAGLREALAKPADGAPAVPVRADRRGRRVQVEALANAVRAAVDAEVVD